MTTMLSFSLCAFLAPLSVSADARTVACQTRLQHWWNSVLGSFYDGVSEIGWWHVANGVEILASYGIATGDTKYVTEVCDRRFHSEPDFLIRKDYSFDDQGWMALSWVKAHELTGEARFQELAVKWWQNILSSAWTDSPCNGGLYWAGHGKTLRYKNAITNSLFIKLSAKLYTITTNTTYLQWASRTWEWFEASGMIVRSGKVVDGLTDTCVPTGIAYTYNAGTVNGALAALFEAGNKANSTLLDVAWKLADVLISREPILKATGEGTAACAQDCWQFKGIFMRNLLDLHKVRPLSAKASEWVRAQADSLWTKAQDNKTGSFGLMWAGPFDKADPIRQMSALDAFLAADGISIATGSDLIVV